MITSIKAGGRCGGRNQGWVLVSSPAPPLSAGCVVTGGSGARVDIRAFNEDSRRFHNHGEGIYLLGPPPGWKHLLVLSDLRHYAKQASTFSMIIELQSSWRLVWSSSGHGWNVSGCNPWWWRVRKVPRFVPACIWCCLVGVVGIGSCPLQSASPPRYPGSRVMAASMRDQEHSATSQ